MFSIIVAVLFVIKIYSNSVHSLGLLCILPENFNSVHQEHCKLIIVEWNNRSCS